MNENKKSSIYYHRSPGQLSLDPVQPQATARITFQINKISVINFKSIIYDFFWNFFTKIAFI